MRFELLLAFEVVELLERLPLRDRRSLRQRLGQIRDFPSQHSDFAEHDSRGRRVDINVCGRFAIKYWTDQADHQIKVIDIHSADRPL